MDQLIGECLLKDEDFLNDYVISKTEEIGGETISFGTIKNSPQHVLIRKIRFEMPLLPRFKALCRLFRRGIVVADNMFIKRQADSYYFYVIEADISSKSKSKFRSLKSYIEDGLDSGSVETLIDRIIELVQAVHKQGENYLCLCPSSIVVEEETDVVLQLSPFPLNQTNLLENMRSETSMHQAAYLSPEIFQKILLKSEDRLKLSKKDLIAADYWSVGCLTLQMTFLATPAFLSVDAAQQNRRFKQFFGSGPYHQWISSLPTGIKSLVLNCMNKDPALRCMKVDRLNKTQEYSAHFEESIQPMSGNLSESSLSLSILCLTDYDIKQQLKIVVNLFTKFSYYIEKSDQSSRIQRIDKIINVQNSFQQFHKLLQKPVVIEFQDGSWKGTAKINLSTLVLKDEGKRVWRKPIIGSYDISNCNGRIRVSCCLVSPEETAQNALRTIEQVSKIEENANRRLNEPSKFNFNDMFVGQSNRGIAQSPSIPSIGLEKPKQKSSILAISEELSNLTMLWKSKEVKLAEKSQFSSKLLRL